MDRFVGDAPRGGATKVASTAQSDVDASERRHKARILVLGVCALLAAVLFAPAAAQAVECSNGGTGANPAGNDGGFAESTACGQGADASGADGQNTAIGSDAIPPALPVSTPRRAVAPMPAAATALTSRLAPTRLLPATVPSVPPAMSRSDSLPFPTATKAPMSRLEAGLHQGGLLLAPTPPGIAVSISRSAP
jgi:hypothetical protein